MEVLSNPIRAYPWGSRTGIAALQGRPVPSPTPEAELWMGAHPAAPSTVRRRGGDVSLVDVVAEAPVDVLGSAVVAAFGARLPYLLKMLAVDAPLSLQVHPDALRARTMFAAERAGTAPTRSYVDPYHKPEMLVAISPFEGLCGLRDPVQSARLLAALGVPALTGVVDRLAAGVDGLHAALHTLLGWPEGDRAALVGAVAAAAAAVPAGSPFAAECTVVGRLAALYPTDVGVVTALLLNRVVLAPGEALWIPPGNLHSYLSGVGLELMAASDNVIRGGLTSKHVDMAELLRVVRFAPLAEPVVPGIEVAPGVRTWRLPVSDFGLFRIDLDAGPVEAPAAGPRTVFCIAGAVTVADGLAPVTLAPGRAAFGGVTDRPLRFTGTGTAFLATTNL